MMPAAEAVVEIESLRDARRSFTRDRICSAAREVFAEHGFTTATLEQIAQAAGTRRSTVYNHFRDKEDILAAIAENYSHGMLDLIERLPGPVPTRAELDPWIAEVAAFTSAERTPTVLLIHLGDLIEAPAVIHTLGHKIMMALATRLPAFRRAVEPGPEQGLALARASAVLRHLGWACLHQIAPVGPVEPEDMLIVAAEYFERFVREGADEYRVARPD